ncbi:hypothetical protein [uncultured Neptuniibacter sp.]|uniref:hypothetical protein n=1 Tax=uncultured Neptuniibacter sp. TaxID=502143 RepID=UPI002616CE67|nr:hypothetical protein [uncultured Neptuniibacter sp.]
MKLLNRSAFVVLPRQPFADWTNGLDVDADGLHQSLTLEEQRREGTVYLIDEVSSDEDFKRALKANWLAIFQNELSAWDELGDFWPHDLNQELFSEWFDIYPQIMALDLAKQPLMMASLESV